MVVTDAAVTARLHLRTLPGGMFPRLGPHFMAAFHRSFVDSPHAVAFVPTSGPRDGFLVGTTDQIAHVRWVLRRRGMRLALLAAAPLLRHPSVAVAFLRTRSGRYLGTVLSAFRWSGRRREARVVSRRPGSGAEAVDHVQPPIAVLWHLAVHPEKKGRGIGRALVDVFVQGTTAAGSDDLRLVTDLTDGAGPFYETLGWRSVDIRSRHGRQVVEYRWSARSEGDR